MSNPKTLLAVFAHPDDEAFGTGGTLARYAAEGVTVKLVCATRGESGKITDPDIDSASDVAALREQELSDACQALGLEPPTFLDYHDSGRQERVRQNDPKALMNVPEEELERILLAIIEDFRPQVMVTFDPKGIYGHVDHLKIHRAATAAFWSAGSVMQPAPRRLFYTVQSIGRLRAMQETRDESPLSGLDPALYGVTDDSFAAVLNVQAYAGQKEAAIRAHRTQTGPKSSFAGIPDDLWRQMFVKETFTLGGLRGGFPDAPVDDLFAGLWA